MRPRISAAALRVNVIARMFAGSTPRLNRLRYRSTSTCVLPVPADASSTTLCAGSTALARAAESGRSSIVDRPSSIAVDGPWTMDDESSSKGSQFDVLDVANVVLSTDERVCAAGAHHRVRRRWRKFTALDSVDGIEQASLRIEQHGVLVFAAREHRHELAILAERDVSGLPRLPLLSTRLPQMLHGANRVDGQLQRELAIGRAAQLVIDDAKRMVLQQIDAIGFSTQRDAPRLRFRLNFEFAVERMLQQSLHDRSFPFRLDLKHGFCQPLVGGRTEQPCALHGRLVFRQSCEQRLDDLAENRAGLRQVVRRNPQVPLPVPFLKKLLEDFVDEDAELFRVERRFVLRILLESEHALGKELER